MKNFVKVLVCVTILACSAVNSFATLDTATISYQNSFTDGYISLWYTGGSFTSTGGIHNFSKTASDGLGDYLDDSFQGVCIELSQYASSSNYI